MNEFSSKPFLTELYMRNARSMPFPGDGEAFPAWQKKAKEILGDLLAVKGCPTVPNLGTVFETRRLQGGFIREHILLRTAPELWMTAFILYKDGNTSKKPAAILPSAEGAGKFGVIWADDYEMILQADGAVREKIEKNRAFSFALAEKGYIVFAPDTMGSGERREWMDEGEDHFFKCSHRTDNNVAIALGESLGGLIVHELRVAADYLESRPDYSGELIACGTESAAVMSILFALSDERVRSVYAQNWLYDIKSTVLKTGEICPCACVPGLWHYFENCDLAAMLAPRRLVVSGYSDETLEAVRIAYGIAGCESQLTALPASSASGALNPNAVDAVAVG